MTRRIDIELTSDRGDGTWTWRAAGAKQPKGSLEASTLYDGAQVGDVCRADADFALDGVFIETVLPPKARSGRKTDETIEMVGRSYEGGVTTTWKERKPRDKGRGKGRGDGRGRGRDGDGKGRGGEGRGRGGDSKGRDGKGRDGDGRGRDGGGDKPRRERGDRRPRRDEHDDRPKPKRLR
ncbi:MAG: hypothetical protein GY708_26470, partial [Actinomycetia bacterium]|nr:hypothetical protein [Actinomycetes bacterium]